MEQQPDTTPEQHTDPTWTDLRKAAIEADSSAGARLAQRYCFRDGRMPEVLDVTQLAPTDLLWAAVDFSTVRDWSTAGPRRPVQPLSADVERRLDAMIAGWDQEERFYGFSGSSYGLTETHRPVMVDNVWDSAAAPAAPTVSDVVVARNHAEN